MKNRLIAAVTAAALALSSVVATPAAAMSEKDRKALTLLLGAAAVGLIISESNKNKKKRQAAEVARNPGYGYDYRREDYGTGFRRPEEWQPGHHNRRAIVPAQCVFSIRGSHGPRDVVSSRCLSEYGLDRRLPRDCAFEIDTGWGSRSLYGAHCLRQNGFAVSRLR